MNMKSSKHDVMSESERLLTGFGQREIRATYHFFINILNVMMIFAFAMVPIATLALMWKGVQNIAIIADIAFGAVGILALTAKYFTLKEFSSWINIQLRIATDFDKFTSNSTIMH